MGRGIHWGSHQWQAALEAGEYLLPYFLTIMMLFLLQNCESSCSSCCFALVTVSSGNMPTHHSQSIIMQRGLQMACAGLLFIKGRDGPCSLHGHVVAHDTQQIVKLALSWLAGRGSMLVPLVPPRSILPVRTCTTPTIWSAYTAAP